MKTVQQIDSKINELKKTLKESIETKNDKLMTLTLNTLTTLLWVKGLSDKAIKRETDIIFGNIMMLLNY